VHQPVERRHERTSLNAKQDRESLDMEQQRRRVPDLCTSHFRQDPFCEGCLPFFGLLGLPL